MSGAAHKIDADECLSFLESLMRPWRSLVGQKAHWNIMSSSALSQPLINSFYLFWVYTCTNSYLQETTREQIEHHSIDALLIYSSTVAHTDKRGPGFEMYMKQKKKNL